MYQGVLLTEIEKFTDSYKFTFQFWGENNNNVYIDKDDVEVAIFGGRETIVEALKDTLLWLYKVNQVPERDKIFNINPNF